MRTTAALLLILAGCGARTGLVDPDAPVVPIDAPVVPPDAPVVPPDAAPDLPGEDAPATDVPVVDVPLEARVPICGDGVRDPSEECDEGPRNASVPAFSLSQPGRPAVAVTPVARRATAAGFYAYRSASAHTGFERVGVANVFLYVDTGGGALSLFFLAGRDGEGASVLQPRSEMEVFFRGVPSAAALAVSDDAGEFERLASGDYRGRWTFEENTDGCALVGLPWDAPWRIVLEGSYRAGVSAVQYIDGDARPRALSLRDAVVLEHAAAPAACRVDCRLPRCGDGFVDGGERCDDGNTRGGDGCSADCRRAE